MYTIRGQYKEEELVDDAPSLVSTSPIPYKEIIRDLNEKAGSNYRATTKKTRELIQARMKEKFTLDNFKKVIDTKSSQWLNDPEM